MNYQQLLDAIVTIARRINNKLNQITSHINRYQTTVDNNNSPGSVTTVHQDIEANNALIEELSDTIHYLTQQQREIINHNFKLQKYNDKNNDIVDI